MPFGYLKDPLFLCCFVAYWPHRWLAAHGMSMPLLRAHLNDLICIPFFVPMMLWVERQVGLRRHDRPPNTVEVIVPLVIIAFAFEVVLPSDREWRVPTIADPKDVLAYCVGALLSVIIWNWRYRARNVRQLGEAK
jgi:hypothetical protein